jgi:hypothetical protein
VASRSHKLAGLDEKEREAPFLFFGRA